jgi:hypothetical protein
VGFEARKTNRLRADTSWEWYYRSVQRTFPKLNSTFELGLMDKEGDLP